MTPTLVDATGLARHFGSGDYHVTALLPATFMVNSGDRIALMGASGSGKSTLLNLIAGLDEPSAGTVAWPAIGPPETLRPLAVGMIHQFAALIPTLSVTENVALPLRLGHVPAVDAAVAEAIAQMGLSDFADRMPGELSGGQAQRAGIARALAHRPKLLLADEPTGQLDQATGQSVLTVLLDYIAATGAGLVIATHDTAVADRLDEVWRMDHGKLFLTSERASAQGLELAR